MGAILTRDIFLKKKHHSVVQEQVLKLTLEQMQKLTTKSTKHNNHETAPRIEINIKTSADVDHQKYKTNKQLPIQHCVLKNTVCLKMYKIRNFRNRRVILQSVFTVITQDHFCDNSPFYLTI